MKIWKYPISGSQLYFLAFVVYFLPSFLGDTTFAETFGDHWLRVLSYLSLPFLFFKIFILDKWDKKQLLVIFAVFVISVIAWRSAHELQLLMIVPFVIGARDVSLKKILCCYIYLCTTLMLATAIFSLLNIIPNLIFYSSTRPTRYSLGMNYTSNIATHFLYLSLAYCYVRFNKLKWLDYCVIVFGDIICMLLTNTRLDFIATLFIIPVMMIAQKAFRGDKLATIIASFWWMAVPIFSTITIVGSYFFTPSNHIMNKIDALTSGRLTLGHEAFNKCKVNLFGNIVNEHSFAGVKGFKLAHSNNLGNKYFYVDSSFMRMFLLWGFLTFMLIVFCFTYIAIRSTVHKTFIMSAIILVASLNFMFEPDIIKIIYDPFLMALLAKPYFYEFQEENIYAKKKD